MYEFLKFLHILAMFLAVSLFVGGQFYLRALERSRDVRAIRRGFQAGKTLDGVGIAAVLLGLVLGIVTAINGNLDLTQTWLILAYVLFLAIMAMGIAYWTPRSKRILEAAEASPEDAPSPALVALLERPVDRSMMVLDLLLWAGIIFVMVIKPFS
ncbi:MAG: DUF2269 family protein [Actinomycetota bacterium]